MAMLKYEHMFSFDIRFKKTKTSYVLNAILEFLLTFAL